MCAMDSKGSRENYIYNNNRTCWLALKQAKNTRIPRATRRWLSYGTKPCKHGRCWASFAPMLSQRPPLAGKWGAAPLWILCSRGLYNNKCTGEARCEIKMNPLHPRTWGNIQFIIHGVLAFSGSWVKILSLSNYWHPLPIEHFKLEGNVYQMLN